MQVRIEDAIEKLITLASSNPVAPSKRNSYESHSYQDATDGDLTDPTEAKFLDLSYDSVDDIHLVTQEKSHGSFHLKPKVHVKSEVSSVGRRLVDSADSLVDTHTEKFDRNTDDVSCESELSEPFKEFMRNFMSANSNSDEWHSTKSVNMTNQSDNYHNGQIENDTKITQEEEAKYGPKNYKRTSKRNSTNKANNSTMNNSVEGTNVNFLKCSTVPPSWPDSNQREHHFKSTQQPYQSNTNSHNFNAISQTSVQGHPKNFSSNNYGPLHRPQPGYFNGPFVNQAYHMPSLRYQVPRQSIRQPGQGNYGQGRHPPGFALPHFVPKPPRKPPFQLPSGKVLVMMRGLPGSGKSTFARNIKGNGVIYSTDEFFMHNGKYQFDIRRLSEAHEWNQIRAREAMQRGISPVIIDNTNVQAWQMKPYVSMAQRLGYQTIFKEPDTSWKWNAKELFKKNHHGVSLSIIRNLMDSYEHDLTIEHVLKSSSMNTKPREEIGAAPEISQKTEMHLSVSEGVNEEKPENFTEQQMNLMQNGSEGRKVHSQPQIKERSEERQPMTKPDIKLTNRRHHSLKSNNAVATRKVNNELSSQRSHGSRSPVEEFEKYMAGQRNMTKNDDNKIDLHDKGTIFSPKPQRVPRKRERKTSEKELKVKETGKITDNIEKVPITSESSESTIIVKPKYGREQTHLSCIQQDNEEKTSENEVDSQNNSKSSTLTNEKTGFLVNEYNKPIVQTSNNILASDHQQIIDPKQVLQESNMDNESENEGSSSCHLGICRITGNAYISDDEDNDDVIVGSDENEGGISDIDVKGEKSDLIIDKSTCDGEITCNVLQEDHLKAMAVASSTKNIEKTEGEEVLTPLHNSSEDSESDMTGSEFLNTCFPDIDDKTLVAVLSDSGGDVNKAVETILSNMKNYMGETYLNSEPTNGNSPSSDYSTDDFLLNPPQGASRAATLPTKANQGSFQMPIEPAVAFHLFEMFGPIDGVDVKGEFSAIDLSITIDFEFSKLLYHQWKKSVQARKVSASVAQQATSPKSQRKQKQRTKIPVDLHNPLPPPPKGKSKPADLREIMHEQLALEQSRRDQEKRESDNNMAVVLKRQKLYAMFPGVDPLALEELFEANRYELQPTVTMVEASCNILAKPTFLIQDEIGNDDEEDWAQFVIPDEKEDKRFQALDHPGYLDFRGEANMHYKLRDECFKKAALAFEQKQGQLAQFYAAQGHCHTEKIKEANDRAAARILEHTNAENNPFVLDLHGLHVPEALQVLEERLNPPDAIHRPKFICVVTGRGLHSKQGKAKIKPAVLDFLRRHNYRYEEMHAGQLKVFFN